MVVHKTWEVSSWENAGRLHCQINFTVIIVCMTRVWVSEDFWVSTFVLPASSFTHSSISSGYKYDFQIWIFGCGKFPRFSLRKCCLFYMHFIFYTHSSPLPSFFSFSLPLFSLSVSLSFILDLTMWPLLAWISLCSLDWPWTYTDVPANISRALGLQV